MSDRRQLWTAALLGVVLAGAACAAPLTYQGRLMNDGRPANGVYDLGFTLYAAPTGLNLIAGPIVLPDEVVENGLFSVRLDFGDVFDGSPVYLQASVRPGDSGGAFTALFPRQEITPAPYAAALALPYVAETDTTGPLIEVRQTGTDGAAAMFRANNANNPWPALFASTVGAGHCGQFSISNAANPGNAVLAQTNGIGSAVYGNTTGTGSAARFFVQNANSLGSAVYAQTSGDGAAVSAISTGDAYGLTAQAEGAHDAVLCRHNGTGGTALTVDGDVAVRIASGAIRVSNAGVNTPTCAFVHQVTPSSIYQINGSIIDHPMTNGDPNAIIILTPLRSGGGTWAIVGVQYVSSLSKWVIRAWTADDGAEPMAAGMTWNVLVLKR